MTNEERAIFARLMAKHSRKVKPSASCLSAAGLYFRLIAWMFGQIIAGLVALCLIPFRPRRQTLSAGSFYHDD